MGQELTAKGTIIPTDRTERMAAIDQVISECSLAAIGGTTGAALTGTGLQEMFQLSAGIQRLRDLITAEDMKAIMPLMGSPLGFLTDNDKPKNPNDAPGYPVDVVKDVTIEAFLRGFRMVNNEVNIIAGRFYGTKNGYARKVREYPGLTDLTRDFSVPKMAGDKGAVVIATATWNLDGKPQELVREFAIRVNLGMGADGILGKAHRKLDAAIIAFLTGSEQSDGEIDPAGDADVTNLRRVDPEAPAAAPKRSASDVLADRLKTQAETDAANKANQPGKPSDRSAALMTQINGLLAKAGGINALKEVNGGSATLRGMSDEQLEEIAARLQAKITPPPPAAGAAAPAGDAAAPSSSDDLT